MDGGERISDGGIVLRPVGTHQHEVALLQGRLNLVGVQDELLVDLATEAPGRGVVHEYGLARTARGVQRGLRKWLPLGGVTRCTLQGRLTMLGKLLRRWTRGERQGDRGGDGASGNDGANAASGPAAKNPGSNGQDKKCD